MEIYGTHIPWGRDFKAVSSFQFPDGILHAASGWTLETGNWKLL
jgi:hypothetical protein